MPSKVVGYSFWGFLADVKMDEQFNVLSTPDGNAFYSWSIISELQSRGDEVVLMMPDRDKPAVEHMGELAFSSWAMMRRYNAYEDAEKVDYNGIDLAKCSEQDVFEAFDRMNLRSSAYILHEWRMNIKGRNDKGSRGLQGWQPDLFLQDCIIHYCEEHGIKLVVFDLDYKLSADDVKSMKCDVLVVELGDKWKHVDCVDSVKVDIPFGFSEINEFNVHGVEPSEKLVYVGNRYERDWCIDKYFPKDMPGCVVHGNWKEGGRDSEDRWKGIEFRDRLQTSEMRKAYSSAACTILFAKREYCEFGFMTARIIEAVFYGAVPLFIKEYGGDVIKKYAGNLANLLTVKSEEDVVRKANLFFGDKSLATYVILKLRDHLKFMDAAVFVSAVEDALE